MIKLNRKKPQEQIYLDLFKQKLQNFPQGMIKTKEQPDFLIETQTGVLGIEVTQIFQDDEHHKGRLVEQDKERLNVVSRAKELCSDSGTPPLNVAVSFYGYPPITKRNREMIGRELAELVKANFPQERASNRITEGFTTTSKKSYDNSSSTNQTSLGCSKWWYRG